MKYAPVISLLALLLASLSVLGRPEIEMPNATKFDILFARERLAKRIGCVEAWTIYEIPVRDLDRPPLDIPPLNLPGKTDPQEFY